jgi:FtsP/CotA-like multicopper oxidase with cupredoxin domain
MAWSTNKIWGTSGSWGNSTGYDWSNTEQVGPDSFATFGCQNFQPNPPTPDNVAADVTINRQGYTSTNVTMPDGQSVEFWSFTDGGSWNSPVSFPSPTIRVRQGQIVHTNFSANHGTHTIHHHAIEPTTFNDGVGHTSFEVRGSYTYQWRPAHAGTYFYHCHKNTTLHFEMGMYGLLIVDPASGQKRLYDPDPNDTNAVDTTYDVEATWVVDDVDPTWRSLDHDAGLCGADVGLNIFRPKYFMITGVPNNKTTTDSRAVVNMKVGQRLLIRHVNASYSVVRQTITGLDAQLVGVDGRALRTNAALGDFGAPYTVAAGTPLLSTSAQRHDLLVKPTVKGQYRVRMEFLHWITGALQTAAGGTGIADTYINVT